MKNMRYSLTALLVAGISTVGTVVNADTTSTTTANFTPYSYVGGGLILPQKNDVTYSDQSTSKINRAVGVNGFAGYRASRYWGIEVGYYFATIDDQDLNDDGTVISKYKTYNNHFAASLLGYIPLGQSPFSFYGRLGADYDLASVDTNQSTPGMERHNYDTMLVYGLGMQYDVNQKFSVRADYLLFGADSLTDNLSGGASGVGSAVPRLALSAVYNF